jgi:hypothetical protein
MRWALGFAAYVLIASAAVLVQQSSARQDHNNLRGVQFSPTQKFVVHEWGTFTSFSGSDGVKLEFRPLIDNDLPEFIFNRAEQSGLQNPFGKGAFTVLQRMETPVTYFYTDQPRQVSVKVGFPQGLLTEFYPPVDKMLPVYNPRVPEPLTNSELDWGSIWLIPENQFQVELADKKLAGQLHTHMLKRMVPTVPEWNPYTHARETDSALIYKKPAFEKANQLAPEGGFLEKFLFYRGVGNFALPLKLSAQSDDRFELTNAGDQAIRGLFLVSVNDGEIRFKQYNEILPQQKLELTQSVYPVDETNLADAVEAALIAEGLYAKEAKAMVNTWRDSWFAEEGTRLFYFLPQSETDKLLPLEVKPAPAEMLRVMVGRLEIMRPEDEQRVTKLVQESLRLRKIAQQIGVPGQESAESSALLARPKVPLESFLALGRLAEPALARVKSIAADENVRQEAGNLIEDLREQR